jgi:hypothetical protein
MPKVQHVKARKDYPEHGIQKGDMYYTWNLITGPRSSRTYRSKTPPRRSQLTTSEFLQTFYDLEDRLAVVDDATEAQDIRDELEQLMAETQDKLDNMPESLRESPSGQTLQSRIDGLETAVQELDDWLGEHADEWDTRNDEYKSEALDDLRSISISID